VESQNRDRVEARSGHGYSGIENPLFFKENTRMLYGDAKASLDQLLGLIS
jgi:NAD(P) transhydrogenase subunit beta